MNNLCCVVYVSTAYEIPNADRLKRLHLESKDLHQQYGVTGVLLHHQGTFFQYLEGECSSEGKLHKVFASIKESPSHFGMIELLKMPIEQRLFNNWTMLSTAEVGLEKNETRWDGFVQRHINGSKPSVLTPGFLLLKTQWNLVTGRSARWSPAVA